VAGSSPELFLDLSASGRLLTGPIKGTRPRGADAVSDRAFRRDLSSDPKEQAELMMVVDVERNDLGRVARTGSVRVLGPPRVETFGNVHHRVARVTARLAQGVSRNALLEATLPSGSVTGAPKIRAMEVIAELESERRGLYTGAVGSLGYDGTLRLAMAIRTLTRRGGVAHYFAGGGIVADSVVEREVTETRWKAAQLERLLGPDPP
jgi:anthranilate/para-aminobenzoate synthase component I